MGKEFIEGFMYPELLLVPGPIKRGLEFIGKNSSGDDGHTEEVLVDDLGTEMFQT